MPNSNRLQLVRCQHRLVTIWGGLSATAILVLLAQSTPGGVYSELGAEMWDWFLPTVVPTLSLMIGTVVAQSMADESSATVNQFAYRLAAGTSVAYLLIVIALLLIFARSADVLAELKKFAKLLAALQGLVGIALGAFFVSKKTQ